MLKIRRPLGRLIFYMGIAIPGKTVFLIETVPWMILMMANTKYSIDVLAVSQFNRCKKCIFQISSYRNILINLDLLPKNNTGYFVAYIDKVHSQNLAVTSKLLLHLLPRRNNQVTWPHEMITNCAHVTMRQLRHLWDSFENLHWHHLFICHWFCFIIIG